MIGTDKSQYANRKRSQGDDYMHDQRIIVIVGLIILLILVIIAVFVASNYITEAANVIG